MSSFKASAIYPRKVGRLTRTLCAVGFSLVIPAVAMQAHAECQYVIANQWSNGFTATIKVTNTGTSAINGWSVNWKYTGDNRVSGVWNATLGGTNPYTAANLSWNRTIQPNQSIEFGVQGTKGAVAEIPLLSGTVCASTATSSSSSAPKPITQSSSNRSSTPSSIAASSLAGRGSSSTNGGVGVTFYQHTEYGGYAVALAAGDYTLSQLASEGVRNDDISSLKVPAGWKVVMYEHDNYGGASLAKTSDDSTLVDDGWNDRISSVKVTKGMASSSVIASSRASSSAATTAPWTLDATSSYLNFVTTKNTHNVEVHSFTSLSGDISSTGVATLKIDLNSVNTGIALRDQRMRDLLFKTATFPTATVSLTVPTGVLSSLTVGKDQVMDLAANLDLHGVTAAITAKVSVQKLSSSRVLVQSLSPILVKANDYALSDGIEALRAAVGIASISAAVPVDFTLAFEAR